MIKLVGNFEGTNIYESKLVGNGHGITIPELGIIVGEQTFSKSKDPWLIKHEFGHILQFKKLGSFKFYKKVGFPSLISAIKQNYIQAYFHKNHPVEIEANKLAFEYFGMPTDWPFNNLPIK